MTPLATDIVRQPLADADTLLTGLRIAVKTARSNRRQSQASLGLVVGCSGATVSTFERNLSTPDGRVILAMMRYVGWPIIASGDPDA